MRALALVVLFACGSSKPTTSTPEPLVFETLADRMLPLLPDGAQVIVELDLARLRGNAIVGPLVAELFGDGGALPGPLPIEIPVSPLEKADAMVLASYGAGTSNAAVIILLATSEKVANSVVIADGLVVLGPTEWTGQVEARAAIAGLSHAEKFATSTPKIGMTKELRALREHAMPAKAPGASLRITARLPFDARVALGRATGLDNPPAQLSVWGDVVDDIVIIVDLDAADPGDKKAASAVKRMEASLKGVLAGLANELSLRAVGLSPSLEGAEVVTRGTWVRAIIAVGPKRLARIVERAKQFLAEPPKHDAVPAGTDAS